MKTMCVKISPISGTQERGSVGELIDNLKQFPLDARANVDGCISIKSKDDKRFENFNCRHITLYQYEPGFDIDSQYIPAGLKRFGVDEEELNRYQRQTVGELIKELETIPKECGVVYDNIIIENTNGLLDNMFNNPCKRASIEYCVDSKDTKWMSYIINITRRDN